MSRLNGTLTLRLPSGDNRFKAFFNVGESGFATEEYVKQLIAELEKKEEEGCVKKTDIQDTLLSTDATKPLSAKQGNILKGLLDSKVIEAGAVPIDTEPIEGNINHVVSSDGIHNALSQRDEKLSELDLIIANALNNFSDISNSVEKSYGYLLNNSGQIISDSNNLYFVTSPIELQKGQSLIYRGYSAHTILIETDSDGTFIRKIDEVKSKRLSSLDYSRDNVSIFTAIEHCYVKLSGYKDRNWKICLSRIGTLYDIWSYFKDKEEETNHKIIKSQSHFNFKDGFYIRSDGEVAYTGDSNYKVDETYYKLNNYGIQLIDVKQVNHFPIVAFYDENKKFISGITTSSNTTLTISSDNYPKGAIYARFAYYYFPKYKNIISIFEIPDVNILKQNVNILQQEVNTINNDINILQQDVNEGLYSLHYIDKQLFTNGYYINMSGDIVNNSSFSCTDYLPIPIKKDIGLIRCQTGNEYMACIAFYDFNKVFIKALQNLTSNVQVSDYYTLSAEQIPNKAAYIRVSGEYDKESSSKRPKIDYSVFLKEASESIVPKVEELENRIHTLEISEEAIKPIQFKSFEGESTLVPNDVVTLLENKIKVNSVLFAIIKGEISNVEIGVGYKNSPSYDYRTYGAFWMEITSTQVKVYTYRNVDPILINTYNHSLTLTKKTFVSAITPKPTTNGESNTLLRIITDAGQIWEQSVDWGQGMAFIKNNNQNGDLSVSLKFLPCDITKNVWVFGDSYFSYWPKHLYSLGLIKWLRNSQPGSSPTDAYLELQNLLSLGYRPAYVFWCLGMNGTTTEEKVDGKYVINTYQKTYIDNVKELCDSYNIIPVFMAIPTVPTRQKTGFRNYIQSLGVLYVDTYSAVGADEYGIWHGKPTLRAWKNGSNFMYTQIMGDGHPFVAVDDNTFTNDGTYTGYKVTAIGDSNSSITVNEIIYNRSSENDIFGLLSNDGVHPTDLGARVIAYSVLAEFPEIGICE